MSPVRIDRFSSVPDKQSRVQGTWKIFEGSADMGLPKFSYVTTQCIGSGSQLCVSRVFDPRPTLIWNTGFMGIMNRQVTAAAVL